jgi:uncharacterized protein YjbJ (UPF0337 family)
MRRIALAIAIVSLALGTTACPDKGTAQKAGEKIDETVDKMTHPGEGAVEKAGRKMGEAVDDAKDAAKDAVDK